MAVQLVFNGNLNPTASNLSSRFTEATAFFIEAPLITAEFEIDCYLQIYVPGIIGEIARNIPLGKIEEQAILLNISDTETASLIPAEFLNTELEMALLFLASDSTYLRASIIQPNYSFSQINSRLDEVDYKLNLILTNLSLPLPVSGQQAFYFLQ